MEQFPDRNGAMVINGMNGVQPEAIDMKMFEPVQCIVHEIFAYAIRPSSIKVERITPGNFILVSKIRSEFREIISFGAKMIIYYIQHNCNSFFMTSVHQLF